MKVMIIKWLRLQLTRYRLYHYTRLVKKLNITTDHTAGVSTANLDINQWTQVMPVTDELLSNLIAEVFTGAPIAVMKSGQGFNVQMSVDHVDWSQTKTSAMIIDQMYDEVALRLISNKPLFRSVMSHRIVNDMAGTPTHIVFKLISAKTK